MRQLYLLTSERGFLNLIIFEKGLSYFYDCNYSFFFHSTESSLVMPDLFSVTGSRNEEDNN